VARKWSDERRAGRQAVATAVSGGPKRVIDRHEAVACRAWALPDVDGEIVATFGRERPPGGASARPADVTRHPAWEEGFALGRREGRARGFAEGREQAAHQLAEDRTRLHALFDALAEPLADLDAEVERSVAELAVLIARNLVRRELRSDPGEVVGVVREALGHLPVSARNPRIHLNPEDVELVRGALAGDHGETAWRLEGDPLITRGGCLVETSSSFIDATVEARLAAIVARAFGGERSSDRDP